MKVADGTGGILAIEIITLFFGLAPISSYHLGNINSIDEIKLKVWRIFFESWRGRSL